MVPGENGWFLTTLVRPQYNDSIRLYINYENKKKLQVWQYNNDSNFGNINSTVTYVI